MWKTWTKIFFFCWKKTDKNFEQFQTCNELYENSKQKKKNHKKLLSTAVRQRRWRRRRWRKQKYFFFNFLYNVFIDVVYNRIDISFCHQIFFFFSNKINRKLSLDVNDVNKKKTQQTQNKTTQLTNKRMQQTFIQFCSSLFFFF